MGEIFDAVDLREKALAKLIVTFYSRILWKQILCVLHKLLFKEHLPRKRSTRFEPFLGTRTKTEDDIFAPVPRRTVSLRPPSVLIRGCYIVRAQPHQTECGSPTAPDEKVGEGIPKANFEH